MKDLIHDNAPISLTSPALTEERASYEGTASRALSIFYVMGKPRCHHSIKVYLELVITVYLSMTKLLIDTFEA